MLRIILTAWVLATLAGCGGTEEKKEPGGATPADQLFDKSKQKPLQGDVGKKKTIAG